MSKAEVKAIVIQSPNGEVQELSIDDAKSLYRQLAELFGHPGTATTPVIVERDARTRWWQWNDHLYRGQADSIPAGYEPHPHEQQVWCVAGVEKS